MGRYVARRLLQMVPVLFIVSVVAFALIRVLPGDPAAALVGEGNPGVTSRDVQVMRHNLGLDKPIPAQYLGWLGDVLHGNWGRSYASRRAVTAEVRIRAPYTLQLGLIAFVIALVLAVPAGIFAALHRNSWLDAAATALATAGTALPGFWVGLILILIFGVKLRWLPTNGAVLIWSHPADAVKHLALPVLALASELTAVTMRQTRSSVLEVLREDYVRTAYAKGLAQSRVVWRHVLRNAVLPIVTVAGLQIGRIVAGAVVIETIFGMPGLGRLIVDSINQRDYATVQILLLLVAVAVLVANFVTDLLYGFFDPRIRYGHT
jgi:peptide/nickel transport system permease protein